MWAHPILDQELISKRYFVPRPATHRDFFPVPSEAGTLACWRSASPGTRPVLLHFHGNGEVVGDYLPDFAALLESWGWDLLLAEYRGYGNSDGRPALAGMLRDIPALIKASGVPPENIVAFGRSVGSIYAIETAARFPNLAGLVLESGIADVGQRIRLRVTPEELDCTEEELTRALREHLDHEAKLQRYEGPALLLHAEQDHLVSIEHAEQNYAWLQSSNHDKATRLVRLPYGDHNSIMYANQREYLRELSAFLETVR